MDAFKRKALTVNDEVRNSLSSLNELYTKTGSAEEVRKLFDFSKVDKPLEQFFGYATSHDDVQLTAEAYEKWGKDVVGLGKSFDAAAIGAKALNIAANTLLNMGISMAFQAIYSGIEYVMNAQENIVKAANETADTLKESLQGYSDNLSTLSQLQSELDVLSGGVDSVGNNVSLTTEQYDQYKSIISQVSDIMPNLTTYFNEQGEAIGFVGVQLGDLSQKYKETIQKDANEFWSTGNDGKNSAQTLFKGYQAQRQQGLLTRTGNILEQVFGGIFGNGVEIDDLPAVTMSRAIDELLNMSQEEIAKAVHTEFGEGNKSLDRMDYQAVFYALGVSSKDIENMSAAEFNAFREQIVQQGKNVQSTIDATAEQVRLALNEAFNASDDFYTQLSEEEQSLARNFVSSLGSNFLMSSDGNGIVFDSLASQREFAERVVDAINTNKDGFNDALQSLLNIDPSNLSAADYEAQIDQYIDSIADSMNWSTKQVRIGLKASFGLDISNEERERQIEELANELNTTVEAIKQRFTNTEISLVLNPENEFSSTNIDDLKTEVQAYKEVSSALEKMQTAGDSLRQSLNSISWAMSNYVLIADVVNGKTYLTEQQMLDLVQALPDLQQYLKRTSQGWILEEGAMDAVNDAVSGLQSAYVAAQSAMSEEVARKAAIRLGITNEEFAQIKSLMDAYMVLSANSGNGLTLKIDSDGYIDTSQLSKDQQFLLSYFQTQEMLANANEALDQSLGFDADEIKKKEDEAKALKDYNDAIADAAEDYQKTVKDAEEKYNETIEDLDREQYNADFQYQIEGITNALKVYTEQLESLNTALDGYFENDYIGRLENVKLQYQTQIQYSAQLKQQLDQLLGTVPETSDAWSELASTLETVSSDYFESQRNIIELRRTMFETAADAAGYIAELSSSQLEQASDNAQRIQDIMEHGSVSWGLFDMPSVTTIDPEAVKQERRENNLLLKEEQEYQKKIQAIRQQSIDAQKAYEDRQRQEQREDALNDYNETLADAKEQYDSALESAKESYESSMESASARVAATNTENMLSSTAQWVEDAKLKADDLKQYLEAFPPEIRAKLKIEDENGNSITDLNAYLASKDPITSQISQNGSVATYNGHGWFSTTDGKTNGWIDRSLIQQKSGYSGSTMSNIKIYPDGSAIWQSPDATSINDTWYSLPPGSISFKEDGGNTAGLTVVNENGQEGYLGKDGLLHWFKPGAQMFDTDDIVRVFNADDMNKIVANTGDRYFHEPIGDISTVTQYANGNTSVSFPTVNKNSPSATGTSGAESFAEDVVEEINSAFRGLKGSVSVQPIKEAIYKQISDNSLYKDINTIVADKTGNEVDSITSQLFKSILDNAQWGDFSSLVQQKFAELGATDSTWNEWVQNPDNALKAVQLMKDGSVDSWDMLSQGMQDILETAGINSNETWTEYVNNHPLEALVLLTSSWDMMNQQINQYINDAITIATNGAKAIHVINVEAPQISQASWSNLQTLIANKIQEILNVINETFGSNTVDLNFNVKLTGNEQTNPQGVGSETGNNLVATAEQYLGTPYVWGGESPSGFDCSGLMQYVYAERGISIPRTSQEQFHGGVSVPQSALQPGDLVFYRTKTGTDTAPGHVGMYVGNGRFLEAPYTGQVVRITPMSSRNDYVGARRYYASGSSGAAAGDALVGDEYLLTGAKHPTPELIFSKKSNRMYLAGLNGAETVRLNAGDVVVPYSRTKEVLKNKSSSKSSFNAYPTGTGYQNGVVIDVPDGLGKSYTYMNWDAITNMDTLQGQLIKQAGRNYDSEGYGRIGGRYAVAMTSTFGSIGDYVDIYMSNGRVIHGVIADEKSQVVTAWDSNPANKWGHNNGQSIVEWVTNWRRHDNPPSDGEVLYVVNAGNYFGNPNFAGSVDNLASNSILATRLREIYSKLESVFGTYTTNTKTSRSKVASYRSLGSSRLNNYDFETPFTAYANGTDSAEGGLSLIGEEAPEYAILPNGRVRKLGKNGAELVDLPKGTRILNGKQSKFVDKYTGGVDGTTVKSYADGTGVELSSYEKNSYVDAINKHLSDDEKLIADKLSITNDVLKSMYEVVKDMDADEQVDLATLTKQVDFREQLEEVMKPITGDEYEEKLVGWTEDFNNKINDIQVYYNNLSDGLSSQFNDWLANEAGTGSGLDDLYAITQQAADHNSSYLREVNQENIKYATQQAGLLKSVHQALLALYDTAPTATEKQMILDEAKAVEDQLDQIDSDVQAYYESDRDRILSDIERVGLENKGRYGTGISYQEKELEDIQKQIDKTDDPAERAELYKRANELLSQLQTSYSDSANDYHENLNALRNDPVYKPIFETVPIDEIFDANNEFNDQYYEILDYLAQTSPELVELFKTVAEAAQADKKGYAESKEAAEEYAEQQENMVNDEKLEQVQTYLELQERLNDALDYQLQQQQALTSAKEQMYSLNQLLRDEQAEIESQLKANKHLSEWLDEDTRKLLFNEDDYSAEMNTINQIQAEAEQLYNDYYDRISNLKEEDYWQEAAITAEYEKQMEVLNEKLDIAKQDLAIAKKQVEYNNALRERDTQIYMGNRAVMVADPEKMYNLALEKSQLETEKENTLLTNAENADIRDMERVSDSLSNLQASISNRVEMINSMTEEEQIAFADFLKPVEILAAQLESITFTNPFYLVDTDNTDAIHMGLNEDEGLSHGYDLTYDYEGASQKVQKAIDDGVIDKEFGQYLIRLLQNDHDYKTSTDSHNKGYVVHGNDFGALDGTYLLPMYNSYTQDKQTASNPSAVVAGTVVSGEGKVLVANKDGTVSMYEPATLQDIYPNMTSGDITGLSGAVSPFVQSAYGPQFDGARAFAEYLVGNSSQMTQDNSVTYQIDTIYVTDPVVTATDVVRSLVAQTRGQYDINKNTR